MKNITQYIQEATEQPVWQYSKFRHRVGIFLKNGIKAEDLDDDTKATFRTSFSNGNERLIVDLFDGSKYIGYITLY